MPITRREQSSYLDKEMFPEGRTRATTSSEESSSTPKRSLQPPLEGFPPNTKGTKRCLARKSRKGCPGIPFGTMPSNYSQELPLHCQEDSSPLPRARLQRCKNLLLNI